VVVEVVEEVVAEIRFLLLEEGSILSPKLQLEIQEEEGDLISPSHSNNSSSRIVNSSSSAVEDVVEGSAITETNFNNFNFNRATSAATGGTSTVIKDEEEDGVAEAEVEQEVEEVIVYLQQEEGEGTVIRFAALQWEDLRLSY
jgi:hypothetical protein